MPKPIISVANFVRRVAQIPRKRSEFILFRGHPDETHELLPSVLRSTWNRRREHVFLRELIAQHPQEFAADNTMLERLARMQHYSLPTRLLDLTSNPLVALYFACKGDKKEKKKKGEVVALVVKRSDVRYFDSDTASCIANLAQLKPAEKKRIDLTLPRTDFNGTAEIKRLAQFIREEKPYFDPNIDPDDLGRAIVVKPKFNSRRIAVQSGAFLLFGLRESLEASPDPRIREERMTISTAQKGAILEELETLGLSDGTLFPEIENAARHIRSKV